MSAPLDDALTANPSVPITASPARAEVAPWLLPVLLVLFFCSGTSALIYQVLWLRLLSLVFGVTVYAASTVLAGFMSGLAIGSFAAGRIADRARNPLRLFGLTEILVGVSALATPPALDGIERLYVLVHPSVPDSLAFLTLTRFAFAFGILIVPTFLMGATLPLVIKSSLTKSCALGSRVSVLYGSNTAGAIAGALLAGLYLVPTLGVRSSFLVAVALNAFVGLAALAASRYGTGPSAAEPRDDALETGTVEAWADVSPGARRLVLIVFVLSGFASVGLEIVWFRVLVIFLRATTYAFTIMLATVLAGIAAGSYLVAPAMRRRNDWLLSLGILEIAIGIVSVLSFKTLDLSFDLVAWAGPALSRIVLPYLAPLMIASGLAIFPTALLLGAAFPIGLRLWAGAAADPAHTAARVGLFYSLNVCGAIAGSLAAGFLLLPALGSQDSLILLGSLSFGSGWLLIGEVGRYRRALAIAVGTVGAAGFLIAALTVTNPFDMALERLHVGERPLWREEGVQTTVSVHLRRMGGRNPNRVMYLDGSHQANDTASTVFVHRRIGFLPTALHPDPRQALVVGLGGGATPGAVSVFPGVEVDVVELSQAVVRGAAWFSHINFNLLQRPNVHLRVDDGRNHMLLSGKQYDVITADIILPRHAGAGSLYSAEYFRLVRNSLRDGGLALQWVAPDTEMEYNLIVRTFLSVFPDTTLWGDGSLMVGSKEPLRISRSAFERKLTDPETRDALATMGIGSFERLLSLYVAGPDELRRHVGDGSTLSDDHPVVEYFLSLPDGPPVDLRNLRGDVTRHVVP